MIYLLLDEVQNIESWERAINSFKVDFKIDIYLTGSNAYLLSSELSTLLSGRYIEIKMYPLSFSEYLIFNNYDDMNIEDKFNEYLKYGGLPAITLIKNNDEIKLLSKEAPRIMGFVHLMMYAPQVCGLSEHWLEVV